MESTGNIEALATLFTSIVTNCGVSTGGGGFTNHHAKFKFTILCLVARFGCSVTARKLELVAGYQAASRFFHGLTTVFSAIIVDILSGLMLTGPGYYRWLSSLFCVIPVIAHAFIDARWAFDLSRNVCLILLGILRSYTGGLLLQCLPRRHLNHPRWSSDSFRNTACHNKPSPMPGAPLGSSINITISSCRAEANSINGVVPSAA